MWRRWLWFRFQLRVAGWGLVGELRRAVDVVVDPQAEEARVVGRARPGGPGPAAALRPVRNPPAGLCWVSFYELSQLAPVALRCALWEARRVLLRVRLATGPVYRQEAASLHRYFACRRLEALAAAREGIGRLTRRQTWQAVAGRPGGPQDGTGSPGSDAGWGVEPGCGQALAMWKRLQRELTAIQQEHRAALLELRARRRLAACLQPAGLAVVWVAGTAPQGVDGPQGRGAAGPGELSRA
ncbi:MAG TPA: hypothetical protein VIL11_08375 [Limnochordales bacterium]